ncbi:MAG: hypothetical protein ABI857_13915, partial [Acidobacteriota bacterium]
MRSGLSPELRHSQQRAVPEPLLREKRIDVAKTSVEEGTTAFGTGDKGLAATYVRQAQGALAEAAPLLDAIDR